MAVNTLRGEEGGGGGGGGGTAVAVAVNALTHEGCIFVR